MPKFLPRRNIPHFFCLCCAPALDFYQFSDTYVEVHQNNGGKAVPLDSGLRKAESSSPEMSDGLCHSEGAYKSVALPSATRDFQVGRRRGRE